MNVGEANDVNTVLRWLINPSPGQATERARDAAARLAGRAHQALAAGLVPADVIAGWPADVAVADGAERES